ncbi:MAG: hypothetical protein JNL58_24705 [Planctomyces sp.]|nr:hypothetical protein [Planctomyces sp.]
MVRPLNNILILVIACVLSGCSAVRTEMWTRDEYDGLHPDSKCHPLAKKHLNGVPVMLKVPSHLEIRIMERVYARHEPERQCLQVVEFERPHLSATYELKYTEKMFIVDPQRTAAGEGRYGFAFAGNSDAIRDGNNQPPEGHGYLASGKYTADDETIVRSSELLSTVIGLSSRAKDSDDEDLASKMDLIKTDRLVAFRRFDLSSPLLDAEVTAFLATHLNQFPASDPSLPPSSESRLQE